MSELKIRINPIYLLNRMTIKAAARAIGPQEKENILHLDDYVFKELEAQLAAFPHWHRIGFRLGLLFLEFGAILGAWGVRPFSLLNRIQAGLRFQNMLHSRFPPIRLFCHSLKMLVCLSAYGHPEIEAQFGFPRREWRQNRVLLHDHLVQISEAQGYPSVPLRSADPQSLSEQDYLKDDAHDRIQSEFNHD